MPFRRGFPASLTLPGLGSQKRTLTHVEDLADAAAALFKSDFAPSPVNLPGETHAVIDYLSPIADRFGVELAMIRDCHSEEFSSPGASAAACSLPPPSRPNCLASSRSTASANGRKPIRNSECVIF